MTDTALAIDPGPVAATPAAVTKEKKDYAAICKSALRRALRTFLQAFLAVYLALPALDVSISGFKAAAAAGLTAVLTLAHRALDETGFPSLKAA